jgi:NAD(P)-dependent dehydrogenase (short-subunit alcohol dehydrogenase family)
LRGTLGGITKEVFDPDGTVAMVALMGAAAKSIDLTVENAGLFDRHLQQEAGRQKKTIESLRREYGMAANLAIPLMLGSSPQAKTLGQAIARFVAKPTRLTVTARAKNPTGLGLADVIGSDPAAILEKLDVTAGTDQPL